MWAINDFLFLFSSGQYLTNNTKSNTEVSTTFNYKYLKEAKVLNLEELYENSISGHFEKKTYTHVVTGIMFCFISSSIVSRKSSSLASNISKLILSTNVSNSLAAWLNFSFLTAN